MDQSLTKTTSLNQQLSFKMENSFFYSDEEKEQKIHLMSLEYSANSNKGQPVLVVMEGMCLLVNCKVTKSEGTGILSALERLPKAGEPLPVVFMKN